MIDFDEKAKEIYEQNVKAGWWDDPDRCIFQTLQLVSTEIAEATEGERKDLMDDHLPHRKMGEVELADALIRILDVAGRYGWVFKSPCYLPTHNPMLKHMVSIGGQHMVLNIDLCQLTTNVYYSDKFENNNKINRSYTFFISSLMEVARGAGYDLIGAMDEKLEYNKKRADHKRSARAEKHGKKF